MSTMVLCPGMGSQALGLGESYLEKHPELWVEVNNILESFGALGSIVLSVINKKIDEKVKVESLNRADVAHVLLFTVQTVIGLHIKESKQYDISVVVGYSAGELSGAVISGILSINSAIEVLKARLTSLKNAPSGKMVSLLLPREATMPFLEPGIEVAAINSERHFVMTGLEKDMELYIKYLTSKGFFLMPVKSNFPFHHSVMNPSVKHFQKLRLKKLSLNNPSHRFISSFDGKFKTSDDLTDPVYWSDHPTRKVNLVKVFTTISQTLRPTFVIELVASCSLASFVVKSFSISSNSVLTL